MHASQLPSALKELNAMSGCRFTAVFEGDDADLRSVVLVDREASEVTGESLSCIHAHRLRLSAADGAFLLEPSLPEATTVGSMPWARLHTCVPFESVDASGGRLGMLCHFDFCSIEVTEEVRAISAALAARIVPAAIEFAALQDLTRRLESLQLMIDLIISSSASVEEALEAFHGFAAPLRASAATAISPPVSVEIEDQLTAIEQSIVVEIERKNGRLEGR